jgi:hypothetical protein
MGIEKYTSRGFRIFATRERPDNEVIFGARGNVQVLESSLAGHGPHVRIYEPSGECAHINVEEARIVAAALDRFIQEAEAGELTEKING